MVEAQDKPHPFWFSNETPSREDCVLPWMLERNAAEAPERPCFRFADGETWTCAETLSHTRKTAALLREQGVGPGDFVLVWMPSSQAIIRAWFAINYLGAAFVPINTDYRGKILHHAITESNARLMIAHQQLVPRLKDIEATQLECVISLAEPEARPEAVEVVVNDLVGGDEEVSEPSPVNLWDLQMIIFTSGTTGPSKGVMCPYLHEYTVGQGSYGYMDESDCIMVELPMFHVGGVSPVMGALANGASIALFPGFSTQEFWQRVKDTGATTTSGLIGSMASFLAKAPPSPEDKNNTLRMITLMLNQQAIDVAQRYGFDYIAGFNMTELSVPLVTEVNCRVAGSIGKPRIGCECRVVDEHDIECPPNVIGELLVRTDQPWRVNMGYLNRPEATAAAWRNGWFHTGDLVRRDEEGNYFFVDRSKDAVRRRGENVSSMEVEAEVLGFPSVAEAAVVGVDSELGDQEILVAVVAKPDTQISERDLVEYLIPRMPHYMVPRYIRTMSALPKTATNKVTKVSIREEGVTPDTWDREAENIILKKTKFSD